MAKNKTTIPLKKKKKKRTKQPWVEYNSGDPNAWAVICTKIKLPTSDFWRSSQGPCLIARISGGMLGHQRLSAKNNFLEKIIKYIYTNKLEFARFLAFLVLWNIKIRKALKSWEISICPLTESRNLKVLNSPNTNSTNQTSPKKNLHSLPHFMSKVLELSS